MFHKRQLSRNPCSHRHTCLATLSDGDTIFPITRHRRAADGTGHSPATAPDPGGHLDCYHESLARAHQLKCFTDQNIHVSFPTYRTQDGTQASEEDQKQNYVNAIIAQNPETICS
ncbi:hypothetical protein ElyMa_004486900 [Elysia marginata]|uniref:Uncharacterized protein n=1 Tax=Elysia marginata TaxID=1093978 RepID=A0AAV4HKG3_9GAST|nr:hypothetical protein ElyMa_004486900 [Elysia marginata]